jgi:acyl carrier protein
MEKKTMHIVTVTKKYDGIDIESANVIGAYESIWDARSALRVIFHKICDKLCIEELNAYSYQEEDSFLLRTSESVNAEYKFIGEITTIDTETEYLDIFDDDELVLEDDTVASDVDGWDSLTHLSLMNEIEEEFGFKFVMKEVQGLKDVGELIDAIMERIED